MPRTRPPYIPHTTQRAVGAQTNAFTDEHLRIAIHALDGAATPDPLVRAAETPYMTYDEATREFENEAIFRIPIPVGMAVPGTTQEMHWNTNTRDVARHGNIRRNENIRNLIEGFGVGTTNTDPIVADENIAHRDIFALDDETNAPNWNIQGAKYKKIPSGKEVIIDKETFAAIKSITDEIIREFIQAIKETYKNRLDLIEKLAYNELLDSFNYAEHYDEEGNNTEQRAGQNFRDTVTAFTIISQGEVIHNNGFVANYLNRLEEKARQLFDIESSKYRYYPRLKAAVKYGNSELLSKILTVTRIGKGRVICK